MAAILGGDVIVQAGTSKNPFWFPINCYFWLSVRYALPNKKISINVYVVDGMNYCKETFVNDCLNNWHGREGKRVPSNKMLYGTPLSREKCKFNVLVLHDGIGFFVEPINGNSYHHGHLSRPFFCTPPCFINLSDMQAIEDITQINMPAGIAVQLHQSHTSP